MQHNSNSNISVAVDAAASVAVAAAASVVASFSSASPRATSCSDCNKEWNATALALAFDSDGVATPQSTRCCLPEPAAAAADLESSFVLGSPSPSSSSPLLLSVVYILSLPPHSVYSLTHTHTHTDACILALSFAELHLCWFFARFCFIAMFLCLVGSVREGGGECGRGCSIKAAAAFEWAAASRRRTRFTACCQRLLLLLSLLLSLSFSLSLCLCLSSFLRFYSVHFLTFRPLFPVLPVFVLSAFLFSTHNPVPCRRSRCRCCCCCLPPALRLCNAKNVFSA